MWADFRTSHFAPLVFFCLLLPLSACRSADREVSAATASSPRRPHLEMVASLREDLAAERHPSDGGGRAWLEDPQPATVSSPGPGRHGLS